MTDRIRFHLDENVNSAIASALRRVGADVSTTASAGLIGQSDLEPMVESLVETRVAYAIELNGQIFMTENVPARVNEETGEQLFAPSTIESIQRSPEKPRTFTKLALLKSQLSRSASLKFAPSRLAFLKFVPILALNAILALSVQKIAMTRNAIAAIPIP